MVTEVEPLHKSSAEREAQLLERVERKIIETAMMSAAIRYVLLGDSLEQVWRQFVIKTKTNREPDRVFYYNNCSKEILEKEVPFRPFAQILQRKKARIDEMSG